MNAMECDGTCIRLQNIPTVARAKRGLRCFVTGHRPLEFRLELVALVLIKLLRDLKLVLQMLLRSMNGSHTREL